jgi:hypothetical protein
MSAPLLFTPGDPEYPEVECQECRATIPPEKDCYEVEGSIAPCAYVCLKCAGELAGAAMVARHA